MLITPITMPMTMPIINIMLIRIKQMVMLIIMPSMHITDMFMLICMLITPITMPTIMPIIFMQMLMLIIMPIMHITHMLLLICMLITPIPMPVIMHINYYYAYYCYANAYACSYA